jgi:hypothetical protein
MVPTGFPTLANWPTSMAKSLLNEIYKAEALAFQTINSCLALGKLDAFYFKTYLLFCTLPIDAADEVALCFGG